VCIMADSPVRNDVRMMLLGDNDREIGAFFGVRKCKKDTSNRAKTSIESGLLHISGCAYCY